MPHLHTFVMAFLAATTITAAISFADSLEESLMKLPPEERARQACIVKGLERIKIEKRLPKPDRMKTSIFSPAAMSGQRVVAKGAAVRAKDRWYALSFSCSVTDDLLKATAFEYQLGAEIPSEKWEDLGLW